MLVCYGFYFIRKNVFDAIIQAEEVVILKNNIISEVIDFKKYDSVSAAWNKKNEPLEINKGNLNDPFKSRTATSTPEN